MINEILLAYPNDELYEIEGYASAVIGIIENSNKLVYSVSSILSILMCKEGIEEDEALDIFYYNLASCEKVVFCYDVF